MIKEDNDTLRYASLDVDWVSMVIFASILVQSLCLSVLERQLPSCRRNFLMCELMVRCRNCHCFFSLSPNSPWFGGTWWCCALRHPVCHYFFTIKQRVFVSGLRSTVSFTIGQSQTCCHIFYSTCEEVVQDIGRVSNQSSSHLHTGYNEMVTE